MFNSILLKVFSFAAIELTCCKIKEKDSKRAAFDVVFIARRLNFTCLCDKDDTLHNKEGGHV